MAYRTVETPDDVGEKANIRKKGEAWPAIGATYTGVFRKMEVCFNPEYGFDYFFTERDGQLYKISIKGQLHKDLQKCALQPGEFVSILKKGEKDIGKDNPMSLFKISVSDKPLAATPAAAGW